MILSGNSIHKAVSRGEILISPYNKDSLNPNSYNYRLDNLLYTYCESAKRRISIKIPNAGLILKPNKTYLGSTYEKFGTKKYVMTLLGRSSVGRLGLFLNITADLGHVGSESNWTLELTPVQPIKVYPYMKIGQIAFWSISGSFDYYKGRYHKDSQPYPNKDIRINDIDSERVTT